MSAAKHARPRRSALKPYVVLALGLAVTAAIVFGAHVSIRQREAARFSGAVRATADRIAARLDAYLALLTATRASVASTGVTADSFARYVAALDLPRAYPGVQGIGLSRRFAWSERAAVEAEQRARGFPGFAVWPDEPRPEAHTITLLEPRDERNLAALGFDMSTEPVRREAMARARDTGAPAASGPVVLVQEIDERKQAGFLIYLPLYRAAPVTLVGRHAELVGHVYAAFRADDLFAGIFGTEREPRVAFAVYDERVAPATLLHRSGPARPDPRFVTTEPMPVAGRTWRMRTWSLPSFERGSPRWLLPLIGSVGVLASGLLFLLARSSVERAGLLARAQAARAEAEAANRSKDDFLAVLGHELRNPLAPIVTALELLALRGGRAPEHAIIERQVRHLRRMVDDLLDVAAIARGKMALDLQRHEIGAIVGQALELAGPLLASRRHQVIVDVPAHGLAVVGDESRLVQVFTNLVVNAAKYTDPGGRIEVRADRAAGRVRVRVRDNGIGIDAADRERVFELFTQADRRLERSRGGLGVGLSLARSIVARHEGELTAHSDGPGRGTEMTVTLPPAPAAEATATVPAPAGPAPAARPRRILLVDDNSDAADLLAEVLRAAGHEVEVAYDPAQALALAAEHPPEVAILDIGLPVMDGYELAARLPVAPRPLLIALTGYGRDHDHRRSTEAGFAHHLVKPVMPQALLELLG